MEMPKLQTHMSSKLVIVIGQPDAVNIVGEIVQAMNGNTVGTYGGGYGGEVSLMGGLPGLGGRGAGYGYGVSGGSSGRGGNSGFGGGGAFGAGASSGEFAK